MDHYLSVSLLIKVVYLSILLVVRGQSSIDVSYLSILLIVHIKLLVCTNSTNIWSNNLSIIGSLKTNLSILGRKHVYYRSKDIQSTLKYNQQITDYID